MIQNKKFNRVLVNIAGVLILGRGLFHIIFMSSYIDYVMSQFFEGLPFESLLVVVTSIFPFLEFFVGLLILFKVKLKKTLFYSMFIYITLIVFTLIEAYYKQTIYLVVVFSVLIYVYKNYKTDVTKRII